MRNRSGQPPEDIAQREPTTAGEVPTDAQVAGKKQHAEVLDEPDRARASGRERLTTQELIDQLIEEGRQQGIAQGRPLAIVYLYEARFGPMPPALRSVVEAMRDLPTLKAWMLLVANGTREAVHDALSSHSSSATSTRT
ncbi:hypothetical protein [Sorangium sp. So ce233]|uniref:hypothetical protein n=1 Tax=Sorangium sp. So ce233 TaxID=3133290 RepID=UPI003F608C82